MTLTTLRKAAGLNQSELAVKIGKTQQTVAAYESGLRKPRPRIAKKIADVFGLSIEDVWRMFYNTDAKGGETNAS